LIRGAGNSGWRWFRLVAFRPHFIMLALWLQESGKRVQEDVSALGHRETPSSARSNSTSVISGRRIEALRA
jgi:hypothetical protein